MSNKEKYIKMGRHEIADPMAKKVEQLGDSFENYVERVGRNHNDLGELVRELAVEDKENYLGITRLVTFSDLSEEHDIAMVSFLLSKYCRDTSLMDEKIITEFVQGVNSIAPFADLTGDSFSNLEKLDDKEEASTLLYEMICLCNRLSVKQVNVSLIEVVKNYLTISKSKIEKIESYFDNHYNDYSICKWVDVFQNGYHHEVASGGGTFNSAEYIDYNYEEVRQTIEGYLTKIDSVSKTKKHFSRTRAKQKGNESISYEEKEFIKKYNSHIEYKTVVALRKIEDITILFTTWGIHVIDMAEYSKTPFSMAYSDYDEAKSKISQPRAKGDKYFMTICDYFENSLKVTMGEHEGKLLRHLLISLKQKNTAKSDTWFTLDYLNEQIQLLYGKIMVDYMNLFKHKNVDAVRYFSNIMPKTKLLQELIIYSQSCPDVGKEELYAEIDSFLKQIPYPSENIIAHIFVKNMVEVLQYSTNSTRMMSNEEEQFFSRLCEMCEIFDSERYIQLSRVPFRIMKKDINYADISSFYNAMTKEMQIPSEALLLDNQECWNDFESSLIDILSKLRVLRVTDDIHGIREYALWVLMPASELLGYIGKVSKEKQEEIISSTSKKQQGILTESYNLFYSSVKKIGLLDYLDVIKESASRWNIIVE